ncbi:hypothetical protein [Armatimonas sp.]|uniref:SGNH/GDSL hydrolase family protein n=1 Tax=Armatimonas sp. TaxID=1872638 RepID=UPI00375170A8
MQYSRKFELTVEAGSVVVVCGASTTRLRVSPNPRQQIKQERWESLPEYQAETPGWARRGQLLGLVSGPCRGYFSLIPESVAVRDARNPARQFERGRDFQCDSEWGTLGRVSSGSIGAEQPVQVDYAYALRRLDSIIEDTRGKLVLRRGTPHIATPEPPVLQAGERRLANIWWPKAGERLEAAQLFPLQETVPPKPQRSAELLLPRTLQKLTRGEPLTVLAWGDSVTAGYPGAVVWHKQVIDGLRLRFPKAKITTRVLGWGAHNMADFLAAPPSSPFHYATQVLGSKPDLVISEFLNDFVLPPDRWEPQYRRVHADFKTLGVEWIALTPHDVWPGWMGLTSERDCDHDPRPYVTFLREFCERNGVALADAAARYGQLWRKGIPFTTLMVNAVNHPNTAGMQILAESVLALFDAEGQRAL